MNIALIPFCELKASKVNFRARAEERKATPMFSLTLMKSYNNIYSHVDKLKIKIRKNITLWTGKGHKCY